VAWRAIRHYNSGGWLRGANPRGCLGGDIWAIADGISKPDARKSPPPGKVLVINSAVDVPVGNDASVNEAAVKTYAVSLGSPGSYRAESAITAAAAVTTNMRVMGPPFPPSHPISSAHGWCLYAHPVAQIPTALRELPIRW
jgi:hypothetical protein